MKLSNDNPRQCFICWKIRDVYFIVVALLVLSALISQTTNANTDGVKTKYTCFVGSVVYLSFEGGFFGIVTDGGLKLNPISPLDEKFRQEGIRIRGKFVSRNDMMSIRMWGKNVEIFDVELVE